MTLLTDRSAMRRLSACLIHARAWLDDRGDCVQILEASITNLAGRCPYTYDHRYALLALYHTYRL